MVCNFKELLQQIIEYTEEDTASAALARYQFHALPPEEAEIDAIDTYLRNSSFVNSPLRGSSGYGGLSQAQKEVVDSLDRLIQKGPVTEKDITVYRAMSKEKAVEEAGRRIPKTGDYIDKGFVSTSTERCIVKDPGIVHPTDRLLLKITVPKGIHYLQMAEAAKRIGKRKAEELATAERELLFGRGHTFTVLKWSPGGNVVSVKMLK